MIPEIRSLYDTLSQGPEETLTSLVCGDRFRLEQIDSHGVASAPGFWYDQEDSEWVALVKGTAVLEFLEGQLALKEGDCVLLPAHLKHRVASTSLDAVWLAVHFQEDNESKGRLERADVNGKFE